VAEAEAKAAAKAAEAKAKADAAAAKSEDAKLHKEEAKAAKAAKAEEAAKAKAAKEAAKEAAKAEKQAEREAAKEAQRATKGTQRAAKEAQVAAKAVPSAAETVPQPESHVAIRPLISEEVSSDAENHVPSPLCPECGNLDPRTFLDGDTVAYLRSTKQKQHPIGGGGTIVTAAIPTSIVQVGAPFAFCGYNVKCLPCGTEFSFQLPTGKMAAQNLGKSSVAFLARVLDTSHVAD